MGLLIDGVWFTENPNPKDNSGKFIRKEAAFRNWIPKTVPPVQQAKADLRPKRIAIICISLMRALGRIGP